MLERPHPLLKSLDEATKRIDELELELKKLKDTLAWGGWHFICERDGQVHGMDCRCTALRAKPKEEHMQHPTGDYCSFCRAQWPCGEGEK